MKYIVSVAYVIFVIFFAQSVVASSKDIIDGSVSADYSFDSDKTLSPELEVLKVELQSIVFNSDKRIALATLKNTSDVLVTPKLGIALFNRAGELVAIADSKKANIFSKTRVHSGNTTELALDFSGYINDFTQVVSVKLIFTVLQKSKKKSTRRQWK